MCKAIEDMRTEAKKESQLEIAAEMLASGILSIEQIA